MYSRVLRSFVIINVHNVSKCINVIGSFGTTSKIHSKFIGQNYMPSLINLRSCTTMPRPDKDKLAEEYLAEYLKDPVNEKSYKILQLEIDVLRQTCEMMPETLKPRHWLELTKLVGGRRRRKYLDHLFTLEKKKENIVRKKKERLEEHLAKIPEGDISNHLQYKLGGNALMLRMYDSQMNNNFNWRVLQSMMFGQKLVFDCGFDDKMSRKESKYCARQMQFAFAANRVLKEPFDIHFCNFDQTGYIHQELHSHLPTMYQPHFPINITDKSYLELFDKDKLVYLTPDSFKVLDTFNHEDIYIIGALVDKTNSDPLTMAKAKREGLRMAKLPIDKYLDFGPGSRKALTLNQMINILADVKRTGDWAHAMRHVPSRKLYGAREQANQRKMEKLLNLQRLEPNIESALPQDYSLNARKKFRIK